MNKAFEFASWLFLASIMNLIVPRLLPYFTLERIWKHCRDLLYLFVVWLLYRFVWFPVNRMLAFLKNSYEGSTNAGLMGAICAYMPLVSMALAIACFLASFYFTGHLGKGTARSHSPEIVDPTASSEYSQGPEIEEWVERPPPPPGPSRSTRSRRTVRQRSGYY